MQKIKKWFNEPPTKTEFTIIIISAMVVEIITVWIIVYVI